MMTRRFPAPISGIHSEMEQVFNGILAPFAGTPVRGTRSQNMLPPDIWEYDECIRVEADVPGIRMDDLDIFVRGNELTLRGKWNPTMEQVETWHRQERPTGEFSRVVELSANVDAGKVEASLENGVLNVTLPKSAECRPRKIQVKQIG